MLHDLLCHGCFCSFCPQQVVSKASLRLRSPPWSHNALMLGNISQYIRTVPQPKTLSPLTFKSLDVWVLEVNDNFSIEIFWSWDLGQAQLQPWIRVLKARVRGTLFWHRNFLMGLDISDKIMTIGFILRFVVAEKNIYLIVVRRTLGMKGQRPETLLCWHPKRLALPF